MTTELLTLQILIFGFALWLGCYLIGRAPGGTALRLAGLGLGAYALGLALDLLGPHAATTNAAIVLARVRWPLFFLPALCWIGAVLALVPRDTLAARFSRVWRYGLLPVALLLLLAGAGLGGLLPLEPPGSDLLYLAFAGVVLLPLVAALGLAWRTLRALRPHNAAGALLAATLFFSLGTGLLLYPLDWLPPEVVLLLIGLDLAALGGVVALLDAFDQGEALLPDLARSLVFSMVAAAVFGGQVVLAMRLGAGVTLTTLALLLATIATAIAGQVFLDRVQALLDRLVFARWPRLRRARADLRAAAAALPRLDPTLDVLALDEAEFTRLTRLALSRFGDLPRLAASPLIALPTIDARLAGRGAVDDVLERAAELKAMLAESVHRLKPRDKGDFGTTDEWRHYNALYFPYIAGLKPYSRRPPNEASDPTTRAALEWFQTQVPERTLYNWQTAATRLVARDLRERS